MIALDTIVLARFYISPASDDRKQAELVEAILTRERPLFVPITVSLELAWLLKAVYEQAPAAIKRVFDHLLALPNITVEDRGALTRATEWHIKGLEFANALHLPKSSTSSKLVTFDSLFVRRAAASVASCGIGLGMSDACVRYCMSARPPIDDLEQQAFRALTCFRSLWQDRSLIFQMADNMLGKIDRDDGRCGYAADLATNDFALII